MDLGEKTCIFEETDILECVQLGAACLNSRGTFGVVDVLNRVPFFFLLILYLPLLSLEACHTAVRQAAADSTNKHRMH